MKPLIKTPITYYGGKQSIISNILPIIPHHTSYTELFFGGGTVFFSKSPAPNETINDRLDITINFYKCIKSSFSALKQRIEETLFSRTEHRRALEILRNPKDCSNVELAWAFWMCCNFSFMNKIGGGIKFSNDSRTTPAADMRRKKLLFTEILVERLENTHIENDDARKILRSRNVSGAFHFLDPPYWNADQGHYKGYTENDFIDLLDDCVNIKGCFLLTNYTSDILETYIREYKWHRSQVTHHLKQPRRRSGDKKVEVLVTNYPQTHSLSIF